MARKIVLGSPLTPVALAKKLKTALGGRDREVKAGVTGQGTDRDMMLFYLRPNVRNAFPRALTATIEPDGDGSRIAGKIGAPPSAAVFLGCWFGVLTLFLALAAHWMIESGTPFGDGWRLIAIPLALIAFGGWLYRRSANTAKEDEAAIFAFLADTVSARPV
jgi:hypothetical protein